MASGSSGRPNSGFDFGSDDILSSYDDFSNNQDSSNGTHSDPSIATNPTKDFQKTRISRSSVFPTSNAYAQPEESLGQEVILTVERTMIKYVDNLMRFLEGISSRLSQLELYCYNLDKSIGEMRSDLVRDHGETESKLKFLEKHLQEVHRSVQILRDKQELVETQKELAKLQLAQKGSLSPSQDERDTVSASEPKKNDDVSDAPNTQLALALPSQIAQQPSHPASVQQQSVPPPQPSSQTHSQMQSYYMPPNQLANPQAQSHTSYLSADAQYRVPQAPKPSQSQVNQTPQSQQFPHYQQQWPQQVSQPTQLPQQPPVQQPQQQSPMQPPLQPPIQPPQQPPMQPPQQPPMQPPQQPPIQPPQQQSPMQPPQQPPMQPPQQPPMQPPQQPPMQPPQQPPMQPPQQPPMQPQNQIRSQNPQSDIYPPYMANQSANQSPPEGMSSSMSMQMPMPYGYGGANRPVQPQSSPPHMKGCFPSQPGDGYATGGSHPSMSSAGSYMLYDSDGGRSHHPSQPTHYSQGAYPSTNPSLQNLPPPGSSGVMIRNPSTQQYVRNHPYNELIDKLVSMGYRGDHVVNVIQRLEESGQAVDFNAVLDRLNGHSSGSSQRSW